MPPTKNQHYVPKGYLRAFAIDERIQVLDKETAKTYPANIKNVGCENRFYDISPTLLSGTQDPQVVETELARIDDRFVKCRDSLLLETMRNLALPMDARHQLVEFLAIQWLRTQVMRHALVTIVEATASVPGLEPSLLDSLRAMVDGASFMHARMMFASDCRRELDACLTHHIWLLGYNLTETLFCTSDSPVLEVPHASDAMGPIRGLASKGIEVAWPLSPRHILLLFERSHHKHLEEIENRVIPLPDTHAHVLPYNQRQVVNAYRQVYTQDGDFTAAHELLELNPSLRKIDRPRVEIVK